MRDVLIVTDVDFVLDGDVVTDPEPERLGEPVPVTLTDCVLLGDVVADHVKDAAAVADLLTVCDTEPELDREREGEPVLVTETVLDLLWVDVTVPVTETEGDLLCVGDFVCVGETEGDLDCVGLTVPVALTVGDRVSGVLVAEILPVAVAVGDLEIEEDPDVVIDRVPVPETDLEPVLEPERELVALTVPVTEDVGDFDAADLVAVIDGVTDTVDEPVTDGEPVPVTLAVADPDSDGEPVGDTELEGEPVLDTVAEVVGVAGLHTAGSVIASVGPPIP